MQQTESETSAGLVGVVGATASGKTALGVALAQLMGARFGVVGEVVSMDSMLVYRGLDVGTAKPTLEERAGVRHHLIDAVEPEERFDVASFTAQSALAEAAAQSRGAQVLYCGGTAFYLQALLFGLPESPPVDLALRERLLAEYEAKDAAQAHARLAAVDPVIAARLHPNDKKRVVRGLEVFHQTGEPASAREISWAPEALRRRARLVLLEPDLDDLDARILARTRAMFVAGWPAEALAIEPRLGPTAKGVLGYREAAAAGRGELTPDQAIECIALATRQFARRQRTWLRRFQTLGLIRAYPAPQTQADLERIASEVLLDWFPS